MKNKSNIAIKILTAIITLAVALSAGLIAGCKTKVENGEFTVTFNYNYAEAPENIVTTVKEGKKVDKPADPERTGYTFEGWYLDAQPYDFNEKVKSDFELWAKWKAVPAAKAQTYVVKFQETDGIAYEFGGVKPTSAEKDSTVSFKVKVSPLYKGNPIVKANETTLVPDEKGVYSFTVTQRTEIAVTGVVKDDTTFGGKGTSASPYKISSAKHWLDFVEKANADTRGTSYASAYYELTADIDFGGYTIPVIDAFYGKFNGNGHTLRNYIIDFREVIVIDEVNGVYPSFAGLFGYVAGATISDIKLIDYYMSITSNAPVYGGGLAGYLVAATVSDVTVKGEIVCSNTFGYYWTIGGMAGFAASSSGYMTVIESCAVDVKIDCEIGRVGGVAGIAAGSSLSPVIIANCAINVDLFSGYVAGGAVGLLGPYTSITNCYTTGTVKCETTYTRDATAGGIVGVIDPVEAVVAFSFTSARIVAENGNGIGLGGYVYGTMAHELNIQIAIYDAPTLVYECYYVNSGTFIECGDVGEGHKMFRDVEGDKLFEVMSWNSSNWEYGDSRYPMPNSAASVSFTFTLRFPGEALPTNGGQINDEDSMPATGYFPIYSVIGSRGGDAKVNGYFISANNPTHISCGFYLDGEYTAELPQAYLITDDPNRNVAYLGFADYSEVKGIYYIPTTNGGEYTLMLGTSDNLRTARLFSGAGVYNMGFVYYGSANGGLIYFINTPAVFFGGFALALDASEYLPELGVEGLYITNGEYGVIAYADTKFVGEWYSVSSELPYDFYFKYDLTGTYTDKQGNVVEFTYEYTGDRIVIYVDGEEEFALTYREEGGVEKFYDDGDVSVRLTKYDRYYGNYETDLYIGKSVNFDGKQTGYSVSEDGALKDGKTYTINENGFLTTKEGDTTLIFGKEGGMTGVWTDVEQDYMMYFDGVSIYGFGSAFDVYGNSFTYAIIGDPKVGQYEFDLVYNGSTISTATVTRNSDAITESTITLTLPFKEGNKTYEKTFTLRLDDSFRGTWYSTSGDAETLTVGFRKVKVGDDGEEVTYSYVDYGNAITFNYKSATYKMTFVTSNQMSVTINGGSAAIYKQYDAYYGLSLMPNDGSEMYDFNGLGEIANRGKVTYTYIDENYETAEKVLDYSVDNYGRAVITEEGKAFATVAPRADGLYDFTKSGADTAVVGVVNPFTGYWSVYASDLQFEVGPLTAELKGKGTMNFEGVEYDTIYEFDSSDGILYVYTAEDGEKVDLYFGMGYNSTYGMLLFVSSSIEDALPMGRTDIFGGYWHSENGATIWFDGSGIDSKMGYGAAVYFPDYESDPDNFEVLTYGIEVNSYVLFVEVGEYIVSYAEIPFAPVSDEERLRAAVDNFYDDYEFYYSDDGEYLFALCYFWTDALSGVEYEDDGVSYSFNCNLYYDLVYGDFKIVEVEYENYLQCGHYVEITDESGELSGVYFYEIESVSEKESANDKESVKTYVLSIYSLENTSEKLYTITVTATVRSTLLGEEVTITDIAVRAAYEKSAYGRSDARQENFHDIRQ